MSRVTTFFEDSGKHFFSGWDGGKQFFAGTIEKNILWAKWQNFLVRVAQIFGAEV